MKKKMMSRMDDHDGKDMKKMGKRMKKRGKMSRKGCR